MEDKDLPEIGFKEKKERKGFLPWLQGRLGFGSRGSMGAAGAPGAGANAGRALGAARFGAGGAKFGAAGGLLAGKGLIATAAIVAVGIGAGLYMNDQASIGSQSSSFSSDKAQSAEYVPAILRRQSAPGSSLDMFADRNKGAVNFDGEAAKAAAAEAAAEAEGAGAEGAADGEAVADNSNMADPQAVLGRLQGASATGLSTSLSGGGSGKMMMGGFKTGQGAFGPKVGFSDMGAGKFAPMQSPKKGKLTAMGAQKQAVRGGKSAAASKKAKGAFNQANAVRDVQKTYGATNIDSMRSTQDQAWEGTTGEGDVSGGAGLGTGAGGAGIVTSPSLDNSGSGGGSGDYGTPGEYNYTDPGNFDISPWASMASTAMMLIMLSAALSAIGGVLVNIKVPPWVSVIGMIICGIAIAIAVAAIVMGAMIISQFGQSLLGGIYIAGGTVAVLAGAAAMSGNVAKAIGITPLWLSAIAGILGLLGSMAGGA
ncbi:MAG: hypothetical protein RDU13_02715 [Elusimicrobiales bacterium]|jgi:hypothetical protein|nr:hypothetical protein [Elusimicrobiales bacterium]